MAVASYILLINRHRPASTDAGITILTESHPKRPPSLFSFCPVSRWWQALFYVQASAILSVEAHHLT